MKDLQWIPNNMKNCFIDSQIGKHLINCLRQNMSEAKTLLAKKVNLKTLTIFTKILILDDWLVPGSAYIDI